MKAADLKSGSEAASASKSNATVTVASPPVSKSPETVTVASPPSVEKAPETVTLAPETVTEAPEQAPTLVALHISETDMEAVKAFLAQKEIAHA